MTDSIVVRTGNAGDVHPVMRVGLAACEENGLTKVNPEKLLAEVWASLKPRPWHYGPDRHGSDRGGDSVAGWNC